MDTDSGLVMDCRRYIRPYLGNVDSEKELFDLVQEKDATDFYSFGSCLDRTPILKFLERQGDQFYLGLRNIPRPRRRAVIQQLALILIYHDHQHSHTSPSSFVKAVNMNFLKCGKIIKNNQNISDEEFIEQYSNIW